MISVGAPGSKHLYKACYVSDSLLLWQHCKEPGRLLITCLVLIALSALQLADLMEEKAQAVTEKTPQITEDLQSKAEEHAGKVAEKARPMADQASETIEGGARRVAKGEAQQPAKNLNEDGTSRQSQCASHNCRVCALPR